MTTSKNILTIQGKEYRLADKEYRKNVDLKDYTKIIKDSVIKVLDISEKNILVESHHFIILNFDVSNSNSREIGKELSGYKSPMKSLCINRPVIFVGEKTDSGRRYMFANSKYRKKVDLKDYADIIEKCVYSVSPDANIEIHNDSYVINTPITTGQAREIGKRMGKETLLKIYALDRYVLFEGRNVIITM